MDPVQVVVHRLGVSVMYIPVFYFSDNSLILCYSCVPIMMIIFQVKSLMDAGLLNL